MAGRAASNRGGVSVGVGRCRNADAEGITSTSHRARTLDQAFPEPQATVGPGESLRGDQIPILSRQAWGPESYCRKIHLLLSLDQLPWREEKDMAPHSSTFAWKIPWMEDPGRLQSMGSQRVGHD